MTEKQYRSVADRVVNFVLELGSLPEDFAYENHEAVLIAVTKEDTRKVAAFHPEIDPALAVIRAGLEDVIRYGMQAQEIEFFKGIGGVTAERCYQKGRVICDKHILKINREVIAEYEPLMTPAALMRTVGTYADARAAAEEGIDLAKRLAKAE